MRIVIDQWGRSVAPFRISDEAMISLALQIVAAFNLVCTGNMRTGPIGIGAIPRATDPAFTVTYRVDLQQGRYCSGDCSTTSRLAGVTATDIDFRRDYDNAGNVLASEGVSRETGRYMRLLFLGSSMIVQSGVCERADFTGFPSRRF